MGRSLILAGRRRASEANATDLLLAILEDVHSGGAIVLLRCGIPIATIKNKLDASPPSPTAEGQAERVASELLHVLDVSAGLANRWKHQHVGTEHVVAALAQLPHVSAGRELIGAGLSPDAAERAALEWNAAGMPRSRQRPAGRSPIAQRGINGLLRKASRLAGLGWDVYVRKSLGHPKFVTNPYPLYRWLRQRAPIRRDPIAAVWVLTRYDDVAQMLRDPRFRKDPFAIERFPSEVCQQLGIIPERVDQSQVSMLFLDPPAHTRVRSAFARYFTPATLAALRPRIELICRRCLDRVKDRPTIDLIADLAYPLPVMVIAEILGFDATDYAKFKEWSDAMTASLALNATEQMHAGAIDARQQMRAYFDRLVPRLQQSPNDSLLSRLLQSEGSPDGLNRDQIFTNCVLLMAAGHETTTNLIGNGVLALLRQRGTWEQLVADPALVESAVEEMLRFDSPVQWTSRVAGEPITIGNVTIDAGDMTLGCIGAANRDPAKFPNPDRFDLHRKGAKHLSFGLGAHYCLGSALAPMEAAIALRELITRYPRLRLATRRLKWMKGLTFRGVTALPLKTG